MTRIHRILPQQHMAYQPLTQASLAPTLAHAQVHTPYMLAHASKNLLRILER